MMEFRAEDEIKLLKYFNLIIRYKQGFQQVWLFLNIKLYRLLEEKTITTHC